MANVLVFKLIAFAIVFTRIRAHLTESQNCVDCSIYNRQSAAVKCPRTAQECGNCYTGYYIVHGESTEILCEKNRKTFTRTLSSTDENDSDEEESDAAPAWVYVLCVLAGLAIGFAVGGVGGILAYKLYFQRKRDRKCKNPEEKCVELHEMLPETRKSYASESQERGEIAYGLIANNTKHFPTAQNPDSIRNQECVPLQANAAPVVSNNLYYADEDIKGM